MPTDIRQMQEMITTNQEQLDKAMALIDQKSQTIEGWKQRLKETNEQWIKETNENRAVVDALEGQIEELKRGLDLTHKAWEADKLLLEVSLADAIENRDRWYRKWERMAEIARAAEVKG